MWIEIFRAGTHRDSEGREATYSEETLAGIASGYNERIAGDASQQAPLVKGHPENDAPAMGWVQQLKAEGGKLFADIGQVEQELYQDIKEGRYRNVSIALNGSELRHVGILGAASPAVKGMAPIRFSELNSNRVFTAPQEYSEELESKNVKLSEDNEQLKNQIKSLEKGIKKEKLIRRFMDSGLGIITPADAESDALISALSELEDDSLADLIVERLASNNKNNSSPENTNSTAKKSFSSTPLSREYHLGNYSSPDHSRSDIDSAVRKEMQAKPTLSYEEALGVVVAGG